METKPRRRWFSYSLRTLLLLTTLGCLWLGWQVRSARERRAVIADLVADGGSFRFNEPSSSPLVRSVQESLLFEPKSISITLPLGHTDRQAKEVRRVFPDAYVLRLSARWN